jgi:hypothetical protein
LNIKWVERLTLPFRIEFPYSESLKKVLEDLAAARSASGFDPGKPPVIAGKVEMSVFNYWQDTLCIGTRDAFTGYQTLEARTRFFAGMFWTGCIGIVGGVVVLFHKFASGLPDRYIPLVLSIILVAVFGCFYLTV